jgi:hypothetical protein
VSTRLSIAPLDFASRIAQGARDESVDARIAQRLIAGAGARHNHQCFDSSYLCKEARRACVRRRQGLAMRAAIAFHCA